MTTTIRRRKLAGAIAIAAPVVVIALGIAAWNDAGKQPVEDVTIAVPLPELSK